MNRKYPFDPALKHHFLIALGLVIWIFVFLYFTEPLDVNEFGPREKLIYMPLYGLVGALVYLIAMPVQILLQRKDQVWTLAKELVVISSVFTMGLISTRVFYLYAIVPGEPNPYTLSYFFSHIYVPAILTILPMVIAGRWSFGKYKEKKLEEQKIEIQGSGQFESLRLNPSDLICIQSSDNYVEVVYLEGDSIKKQLIRNKLAAVEESLNLVVRTHRSFLVNPSHFRQWNRANRKLNLVLSHDLEVPVSKTYQEAVEKAVNSTTES